MDHLFSLEKGSKKHICPICKKRRFVKYINVQSGNYLDPDVGRCDREVNCAYHYTPKQFFQNRPAEYGALMNFLS